MRRQTSGQSIVEMAFVFPLLVVLLFGIIDLGYYIYGYATIYQAARNGAEEAAHLPPHESWLTPITSTELCTTNVIEAVSTGAVLFPDLLDETRGNQIRISYPGTRTPPRALGEPVEVHITYNIEPLTPLWRFMMMGNDGVMTVRATARRTIESLGEDPSSVTGVACDPKPAGP